MKLFLKELSDLLRQNKLTMGTAESCTGGSIAATMTSVAGSSAYFWGGVVAYQNEVKHKVLGVSNQDLMAYGAVSEPVVRQMAEGACRVIGCNCAVATSGVAGPGGGSPQKPVGTVWIAASLKGNTIAQCCHFKGDRAAVIKQSVQTAMSMLIHLIRL